MVRVQTPDIDCSCSKTGRSSCSETRQCSCSKRRRNSEDIALVQNPDIVFVQNKTSFLFNNQPLLLVSLLFKTQKMSCSITDNALVHKEDIALD